MNVDKLPPAPRYEIRAWRAVCPADDSHVTTPLERAAGGGVCAVCLKPLALVPAKERAPWA